MNAAIWFGSAVFVLVAAPVFFSKAVQSTPLGQFWPGVMVQFVFERFFHLQCICVALAIVHQLAEWVYLGRILHRWIMVLLGAFLLIILAEGLIIEPKLKSLYLVKYAMTEKYTQGRYTQADQREAQASFRTWHGVSRALSLVVVIGLGLFFWKVVHVGDNHRFVSATKFRS